MCISNGTPNVSPQPPAPETQSFTVAPHRTRARVGWRRWFGVWAAWQNVRHRVWYQRHEFGFDTLFGFMLVYSVLLPIVAVLRVYGMLPSSFLGGCP